MPNTRSAAKRVRVTARRTLRNRMVKSRMKTAIRRYEAPWPKATQPLGRAVSQSPSQIDRAAAKGVIHRNEASRRKARLAARLNALAGD